MRRLSTLLLLVAGCTAAPAPCTDHPDCPVGVCVNGGCVTEVDPQPSPEPQPGPTPEPEPGPAPTPDAEPEPVDMGRDMGRDAMMEMDAAPGCEDLTLTVRLPADARAVRRDQPIRLTVEAPADATLSYVSSAGGAFVEEPGAVQWIARDDVRWPWRTGVIDLTVFAERDDCRVSRVVSVTLIGDLLICEPVSGQLLAIGSNGTQYGQWRLIDASGLTGMVQLPDGGFVVGIRGPFIDGVYPEPEIVRLDANGQEIGRFDVTNVAGTRLFTRGPKVFHIFGDEIAAVSGHDPAVHWFDFDGNHLRSEPTDDTWATTLSPWGETHVVGLNGSSRVFVPEMGGLRRVAEARREIEGLYPLANGDVLMVSDPNAFILERLDPNGQISAVPDLPQGYGIDMMTPFGDGYLAISLGIRRMFLLDQSLATPADEDERDLGNVGALNVRCVVWLND